ncbi:MAG: RNA polymerase sigma factor [Planctomycetota bacterium]
MNHSHASATNVSLLSRLKSEQRSGEAWVQFVDRYGSRLYQWSINRGLQASDAEDVTQDVLVKIARSIESFEYDPAMTFRGWLRRITENAIKDFYRQESRRHQTDGALDALADQEARDDLLTRMNDAFDLELLEFAMDRVRARVDHRRWKAWEKCAQDNLSGREVADLLAMPVASVYSARFQVQKLIAAEVALLENGVAEKTDST